MSIIHTNSEIPAMQVTQPGAKDATMQILIGPRDGSNNIIMRYFMIMPGGHTPKHSHDYEHVVKIESGKGLVLDEYGQTNEVMVGQSIFVESNKEHQFQNPFSQPFEFICIILNPDKNNTTLN